MYGMGGDVGRIWDGIQDGIGDGIGDGTVQSGVV